MCNSFSHSSQHTNALYFNLLKHGAWKPPILKSKDHCSLMLLAKIQENIFFHLLIYLWEAQLGWRNDAGILFSSWIIVSLKVDMVRTLDPMYRPIPFELSSWSQTEFMREMSSLVMVLPVLVLVQCKWIRGILIMINTILPLLP